MTYNKFLKNDKFEVPYFKPADDEVIRFRLIDLNDSITGIFSKEIKLITEAARRIANELQDSLCSIIDGFKFADLLGEVIQSHGGRCKDENILCDYLMRYVWSHVRDDVIIVLRSRLPYLTGNIADEVTIELVMYDL